jgi:hypothetical protein
VRLGRAREDGEICIWANRSRGRGEDKSESRREGRRDGCFFRTMEEQEEEEEKVMNEGRGRGSVSEKMLKDEVR